LSKRAPYGKRFEDYLEAIYRLQREKKVVRIRDLAKVLKVKPPSVIEQLKSLSQQGLVFYKKGEFVRLTEKGEKVAKEVVKRHEVLKRFLKEILMIPEETASRDACCVEHCFHEITLSRIEKFLEFIDKYFRLENKMSFLKKLKYYYEHGELPE